MVHALAIEADGSILVGGSFSVVQVDGDGDRLPYWHFIRVRSGGTWDPGFNPDTDGPVTCLVVQPDGKILLSGDFTGLDLGNRGISRPGLGRIDRLSNVDLAFNPSLVGRINTMVLQADGKIIVGGDFSELGGQPRGRIGRLNANGTIDGTFDPGASGAVRALAVQSDGRILAGGEFTTLAGASRARIGRIHNTAAATQSLNFAGSTITWLRGGTSPEIVHATFDYSTDGVKWLSVAGTRVAGGWARAGLFLPVGTPIRARGTVVGGLGGGSGWFAESHYGKPAFLAQPASRTNDLGTLATFQASASGAVGHQ